MVTNDELIAALRALVNVADTNPFVPVGHFVEHGGYGIRAMLAAAPQPPKEGE